ncbi:MAG: DNA replication/repair protein RecF [bacterium]
MRAPDAATYVLSLSLTDMRNYAAVEVAFAPGVTVLAGANGQGKTNLVEALVYLSTLGSHRVATDAPLIREGAERAVVRAEVVRDARCTVLEMEIQSGRANRARINRTAVPRSRDILGVLTTVVFAPEDLALVKGDPADRRRYLDDVLIQRQPRFAGVRADYDRVLKQRNALLKSAHSVRRTDRTEMERTLQVWDDQLCDLGGELMAARAELVSRLAPHAAGSYAELTAGAGAFDLAYAPSVDIGDASMPEALADLLREALVSRRREELDRGITLVGPHRDELALTLQGRPLRGYASQGESWSAALALRLASYDVLAEHGDLPVLILDDVFAELDSARRGHLVERIAVTPQTFITAAVPDDVPGGLAARWFDVRQGSVTPRD